MRHVLATFLVGAVVATPGAHQDSWLDEPVRAPLAVANPAARDVCAFWRTIEQMARQAQVRVGLENASHCHTGGWGLDPGEGALKLDGLTPRAAFDHIVGLRPEFSWREIEGVVVVRPFEAWQAPAHALHRPVTPFTVENVHPHHVLHAVLKSTQPPMFRPHTDLQLSGLGRRLFDPSATGLIDRPVTVSFRGGSLLQALNAVAEPFGGIWQVGYIGAVMHIHVQTLHFQEGSAHISARIEPGRDARR